MNHCCPSFCRRIFITVIISGSHKIKFPWLQGFQDNELLTAFCYNYVFPNQILERLKQNDRDWFACWLWVWTHIFCWWWFLCVLIFSRGYCLNMIKLPYLGAENTTLICNCEPQKSKQTDRVYCSTLRFTYNSSSYKDVFICSFNTTPLCATPKRWGETRAYDCLLWLQIQIQ